MRRIVILFAALVALAGCARDETEDTTLQFEPPETQLSYEASLDGAPDEEIEALMRQSLELFRRQEEGAQSLAFLRRRALQDVETAKKILRSFGYFEGGAAIEVRPAEGEPEDAPKRAVARFTVEPGRAFTLAAQRFQLNNAGDAPAPALDAAALGAPVGERAEAAPILAAEAAAVSELQETGRPYAKLQGRDPVADLDAATLEVDTSIDAGRAYRLTRPEVTGLTSVDPAYVQTYVDYEDGAVYDKRKLAAIQQELSETRLFDTVSVRAPEEPPEGETLAPVIEASEAKHRTVSAGARWSTDLGPVVRGAFQHRNVFGANETFDAEAVAGLKDQRLTLGYLVPQFLRHRQDLRAGLELVHTDTDAYERTGAVATLGLERELSRYWLVGAGGLVEATETKDEVGRRRFLLFGLPVFARYDDTGSLLDPVEGQRLRIDVTPFGGFNDDSEAVYFLKADARASAYLPLDQDKRYVLAGRGRLATVTAETVGDAPAHHRLYSGGGGSVRGYADKHIGPRDSDGDPSGGLSAVELGAELRAKVYDPFGVALFVEAGSVSEDMYPTFEDPKIGAGLGLRYYSPIGPVRADIGAPLNPEDDDDAFQVYLSIGQAY